MKNFQNAVILILLLGLIGYTVYDKMTEIPCMSTEERLALANTHIEIPESFSFCGEAVPLKEPDVRERLDREMHINVFWHASTFLVIKRANKWFPRIEQILKEQGIPEDFKYLVVVESALTNVISPAGATGFWQLLPETAKVFGLEITEEIDDRYDPIKSTYAACKYIKQAYKKFGNWTLVAASYNMG
ncbi:MAG: lytic transglycosylase domain-containing protein, partial [Flammeovirgaceae bacterium]|nr:lytic transglycosylase domain-containing protein [Flammeovirgaceae bacterium]